MAVFDLLSPVLSGIDSLIEPFTNAFIRVTFWAFISAIITSLIFKKLSNPEKITSLKVQLKAKQKQLNAHEGEFSELKELAIDTMKLSMKRMGLTFMPALLASIPIIFVLTYLSNNYELKQPLAGDVIPIKVTWEDQQNLSKILAKTNQNTAIFGETDSINWPQTGQTVQLLETNQNIIVTFPIQVSSIIHKKQWWNSLIGNPAGYLNDESPINRIEFSFKQQKIINFGPEWMHGWLFVFFFMTLVFSIVFLFVFKIKF